MPMPMPFVDPIVIPDAFTVWAATDLHGQAAAVDRLLERAGLMDVRGAWTAPRGTALVVTGDIVDRGPDAVGLVRRLVGLRDDARARGGLVALLQGNHELQVLGGLGGDPMILRALLAFGGGATLASAGLRPDEWAAADGPAIAALVDARAPDFLPALRSFAPWARWRDTLFVHGGPVPGQSLAAFGAHAERLWIRDRFFDAFERFPDGDGWAPYREAGLGRVVFGHTPVREPLTSHGGRAIDLDTWAGRMVTLARIPGAGSLDGVELIAEPVEPRAGADAPISDDDIRQLDRELPDRVDAWLNGAD